MESGSTSYCVYTPGNLGPSRPPLRRAAPEQARSGFPFLIGLAAFVLAVGVAGVAGVCPQDLRFEGGAKHPAKPVTTPTMTTTTTGAPIAAPSAAQDPQVITPTSFTTIGSAHPPMEHGNANASKKKTAHAPTSRSGLPATRGSTSPSSSASAGASATPALPDNPYAPPSPPEAYGF